MEGVVVWNGVEYSGMGWDVLCCRMRSIDRLYSNTLPDEIDRPIVL